MLSSHKCIYCNKEYWLPKRKNIITKYCSRICQCKSINLGRKRPDLRLKNLTNNPTPKGEKSHWWKGGKVIDKDGYVLVISLDHPMKNEGGYVREHRLIMEKHIGRYLRKDEITHHINEIKDDNRIGNLKLMTKKEHDSLKNKDIESILVSNLIYGN